MDSASPPPPGRRAGRSHRASVEERVVAVKRDPLRVGLPLAVLVLSACAHDMHDAETESEDEVLLDSQSAVLDIGHGSGAGRESLPLGKMCDGRVEAFLGEALLERADCGSGSLRIPTARIESAPRFDSPYLPERCSLPLLLQSSNQRFTCAETEFWLGFQDGRSLQRHYALQYLDAAIAYQELVLLKSADFKKKLARLYEYRGIAKTGLGLENGRLDFLLFGDFHSGSDFRRVAALEPGSIAAQSFHLTLALTDARLAGDDELAAKLAWQNLELAKTAGDPDVLERLNVGMIMTVTAMTRDFPAKTGLPRASLDALLLARELPGIKFNHENTPKAPFVRPGLEFMLADLYAQNGMRDEYIKQLEVVAQQDRYQEWAWYDFIEAQRADPDRMLRKYASFSEDEYSDSYASSNNGCVFCHGNI